MDALGSRGDKDGGDWPMSVFERGYRIVAAENKSTMEWVIG